jgi:hypothetical protein
MAHLGWRAPSSAFAGRPPWSRLVVGASLATPLARRSDSVG